MIYLTAHRIEDTGGTGVNAFRYRLQDADLCADGFSPSRHQPELQAQFLQSEPGGKHVCSYLDVVIKDDVREDELSSALARFLAKVNTTRTPDPGTLPVREATARIWIEANMDQGLWPDRRAELVVLQANVMPMYSAEL